MGCPLARDREAPLPPPVARSDARGGRQLLIREASVVSNGALRTVRRSPIPLNVTSQLIIRHHSGESFRDLTRSILRNTLVGQSHVRRGVP